MNFTQSPKKRGWKETQRILKNNVEPHLKFLSIQEITRHHMIDILDEMIARGAKTQANRTLAHTRKLFNWFLDRGVIEHNPVAGLRPPTPEISRDRVLADDELKRVWGAWDHLGWPFGPLCKILLLTAQRRSEVASMRWSDIDFDRVIWTIPREIAKNDRTHDVPLSSITMSIIAKSPRISSRDLIFTTNGRNPVSGFGKPKKETDEMAGVQNWRLHDLRRTAASGMARLGIAPHIVEKVLNHTSGTISGVAAVYNRYGYENEKRDALIAWSEHVGQLVSTSDNSYESQNSEELYLAERRRS